MTFSIANDGFRSRIDRSYIYDDYWIWAFPDLQPHMNFSLVVDGSEDGFACFVQGQNSFFAENPSLALGYADPYLTDYLVHQAKQFALPWLLRKFVSDAGELLRSETNDHVTGTTYIELLDEETELSMLIDEKTMMPYAVRSREVHPVFGNSTSDVILSSWSEIKLHDLQTAKVGSILLPHRLQTVYNGVSTLEDFVVDSITVNQVLDADFFAGEPAPKGSNGGQTPQHPALSAEYPRSEVHEAFESGLWAGPFSPYANVSNVVINHPIPGVEEIRTVWIAYPDYVQVLVEFESGLLITDTPAHRSKVILDWVDQNMNQKKITHVVPSHHHRDHAGGVMDYVNAGATLVVPEVAKDLYNYTGQVQDMVTYTAEDPFVLKDANVEFRSFWGVENPHAEDWTFSIASVANASEDRDFVIFNADVVSPGTDGFKWDTGAAREFLKQCVDLGVPPAATIVGAHGSSNAGESTSASVNEIASLAGFAYPALTAEDWKVHRT